MARDELLFAAGEDYRSANDPEIIDVRREILNMDPGGTVFADVIRRSFDQLYDGRNTGRYSTEQLYKTEKSHFGTLLEINLQRALDIPSGNTLDFLIAGHEVDCKFSFTSQWMLPIESFDEIVLVVTANDSKSLWSAGLVRVTEENRRKSSNRDRKTSLNARGRDDICWLYSDAPIQPNALLKLPKETVDSILAQSGGTTRLCALFRSAQNTRLTNNIIATVAQQLDYMKRVRSNGGARDILRTEGFVILSGDYTEHQRFAFGLGATVPQKHELVSVRVAPVRSADGTVRWRLADADEKLTEAAPDFNDKENPPSAAPRSEEA
ncbi:NaeI family type II restriction endonuclease [Brevibacterium luteolum]|uniref:NaeI family type II restriction endonuclease n=1 Tax=Brevibacterium luteolum TaxID=199591 RepID=UPI0021F09ABE|nr:NaeI family type II restriction endonuclease [Brevibacterium luteolum]MCT1874272.1 restriction endonuclease [Brevibacterium luteolum]MCT1891469.1 restriction endonuclease [Brevibacterium luteolum]MCT1894130.1 restriction endonuclease [Brevibacterium luteolum]MCT1924977.1 restriction endonuclease [Brevibacterium luteolum]